MSALIVSTAWVPSLVLMTSLLGSGHCVGMCGPLMLSAAKNRRAVVEYQLGRLVSYAMLGALAGLLGQAILASAFLRAASWISAIGMCALFIVLGVQLWQGHLPHTPLLPKRVMTLIFLKARGVPFVTGALSALLPCGWLQTFLLAAAATGIAFAGALLMSLFWLGTLPALTTLGIVANRFQRPKSKFLYRVAATLLIVAGFASIGFKMSALSASEPGQVLRCHKSGG